MKTVYGNSYIKMAGPIWPRALICWARLGLCWANLAQSKIRSLIYKDLSIYRHLFTKSCHIHAIYKAKHTVSRHLHGHASGVALSYEPKVSSPLPALFI